MHDIYQNLCKMGLYSNDLPSSVTKEMEQQKRIMMFDKERDDDDEANPASDINVRKRDQGVFKEQDVAPSSVSFSESSAKRPMLSSRLLSSGLVQKKEVCTFYVSPFIVREYCLKMVFVCFIHCISAI